MPGRVARSRQDSGDGHRHSGGRTARSAAGRADGLSARSQAVSDTPLDAARDASSAKPVSRRQRSGRTAISGRTISGRTVSGRIVGSQSGASRQTEPGKVPGTSNGNAPLRGASHGMASRGASAARDAVSHDTGSRGTQSRGMRSRGARSRDVQSRDVRGAVGSARVADNRAAASASRQAATVSGDVSRATGFVDARTLRSEDLVAKTLRETTGPLGVAARPKVVDFNERVKERRHAGALMVVKRVAITIVSVAAVVGVVWALFFSPLLMLDAAQITVSGANEWVSEDKVESIASAQAGKSLLLVSTHDVETQLADIPGVSKAVATKQYPNGMNVVITAQEPAAMLKTPDGSLTAVDGKGRVLNSVKNASTDGIPIIEVKDVAKGLKSRSVVTAVKVLDSLSSTMRARVSKVTAQTQDSITTELDNGNYTVIWGDASQMKLKKAVVDKIINDPNVVGDKHSVDVSAPLRPIIK